ncbi:MAG: PRC-barrel domain-containing protein [Actinomycetota bacterium]
MTPLARATELIGMPVITIDGGEDIAEVKDVVFNPETNELLGFTLNKRGRFRGPMKQLLPWPRVSAVGRDAIMVGSDAAFGESADVPADLANPPPGHDVIGNAVVTDSGVQLAYVTDVVLEVGGPDASVVGYAMDNGKFLPIPFQLAVSGEILVVPAAVEGFLVDDLAGFGSAVDSFRAHLRSEGS